MDDSILRKIKRCLALAKSSNPNEAATALRQAQALMAKHGVTSEDVVASDVNSHTASAGAGKTPPAHIAMLASMVASAFGVEVVYRASHDWQRGKWQGKVEFYGVGSAPEIAGYAFEVLGRQLKRDRNAFLSSLNKRLSRATKVRRGDLYAQGWVQEVSSQVVPHTQTEQESQAIAAYKAKRWEEPLKTCKVRDTASKARLHDYGAFEQGVEDGKKVSFHQGVTGTERAAIGQGVV
jgi:hypothetical protein